MNTTFITSTYACPTIDLTIFKIRVNSLYVVHLSADYIKTLKAENLNTNYFGLIKFLLVPIKIYKTEPSTFKNRFSVLLGLPNPIIFFWYKALKCDVLRAISIFCKEKCERLSAKIL